MGGGWSFQDNLAKSLPQYMSGYEESDIYFIAGASMVSREDVLKAKEDGKKIVLRVDNIARNSRNRGTAMTRMKDFAEWSDLIVYQSNFAYKLLDKYLTPKSYTTIYNSCDQSIFNLDNLNRDGSKYLYARSSSDETKNFEMARSKFQKVSGDKSLTIVGKPFDPKLHEYNFDFFMGEKVDYIGEIHDRQYMAHQYKTHDYLLYSFFNDACSNTLIEALSCGIEIMDCYKMVETGGTPEILHKFKVNGREYFDLPRMADEYKRVLEKL